MESGANFFDAEFNRGTIGVHGGIIKDEALEEEIGGGVGGLFGVDYAAAVAVEELGECSDDSFGVGAVDFEDGYFFGCLLVLLRGLWRVQSMPCLF